MAADVGTLQRLPKIIGSASLARELCYTARKLPASEALSCGLVSKVFEDKKSMLDEVLSIAGEIAKKSPVAIQTTKASLVYSRDHTVQEGLDQLVNIYLILCWKQKYGTCLQALLNQLMLQSEDFVNATVAQATKQKNVVFAKL